MEKECITLLRECCWVVDDKPAEPGLEVILDEVGEMGRSCSYFMASSICCLCLCDSTGLMPQHLLLLMSTILRAGVLAGEFPSSGYVKDK